MSASARLLLVAVTTVAALALSCCREREVVSPQQMRVPAPIAARWYDAWASNEEIGRAHV